MTANPKKIPITTRTKPPTTANVSTPANITVLPYVKKPLFTLISVKMLTH
jgi:hypothetical protein